MHLWGAILLTVLLFGCGTKIATLPAAQFDTSNFSPLPNDNRFLGVAISGGGSRAALFGAAALESLAQLHNKQNEKEVSLLEQISHISGVGGGSLAAAYYAIQKPNKLIPVLDGSKLSDRYREFFQRYKIAMQLNFQERAILRQLSFLRGLNPTKLAYSLAEVWDSEFLMKETFSTLYEREQRGDIPRLILNATLYNTGQRFLFTTLSPETRTHSIVDSVIDLMARGSTGLNADELESFNERLRKSKYLFKPVFFETLGADHRNVPISLAVASSASFPPVVGPVTFTTGSNLFFHLGDGSLADGLGVETLIDEFYRPNKTGTSPKTGLIIVIDASYPLEIRNNTLDRSPTGFSQAREDPSWIVAIKDERSKVLQYIAQNALKSLGQLIPLKIIYLRPMDATWSGYEDLPVECRDEFPPDIHPDAIKRFVSVIPTLYKINTPCNGALLMKAASKVVKHNKDRIIEYLGAEYEASPLQRGENR